MPGMSSGSTRSTIAWRFVRERREAAERRRRTFQICLRRRGDRVTLGAFMSAEFFGLILAAIVAAVVLWIFWWKGKSD